MTVFLSYGSSADQVTAFRLQALAAVNGLSVYVPPAFTRAQKSIADLTSAGPLIESDVVLGLISGGLSEGCRDELNLSIQLGKKLIIVAGIDIAPQLLLPGANVIVIDPAHPDLAEQSIMFQLKQIDIDQKNRTALLALGTLALGLLIFAPQD